MPMTSLQSHKDAYKATFSENSQWKEALREKCLAKIKTQKNNALKQMRSKPTNINRMRQEVASSIDIDMILKEEYDLLRSEFAEREMMESISKEEYVDLMQYLEKQLQEELKAEGQFRFHYW
eukprot:TRINITY_DN2962_c0_g1_i2.p1 TRINITY_DN2962_c0_g1~~TRINITY_DN2962_c0_g1_i2.p1  ORF type:complete len:122 (-),score=29.86 TRINITY_DN2962_c0_g1_i2:355-720(-)